MNNGSVVGGIFLAALLCASATLAVPARAEPAGPAPDFALKTIAGENLRLKELRGQVVLINFWASWCGPCRDEMPLLDSLYRQYRAAGFTLLGVNIDEKLENAVGMSKRLGVSFPILYDADKNVSRLYDVRTMPSTLLIDRDGRIRYVHRGFYSGYEAKYQAEVRELLKE